MTYTISALALFNFLLNLFIKVFLAFLLLTGIQVGHELGTYIAKEYNAFWTGLFLYFAIIIFFPIIWFIVWIVDKSEQLSEYIIKQLKK